MKKVVRKTLSQVNGYISQETIGCLELALKDAKAGKLLGIGIIAIEPGGDISTAFAGEFKNHKNTFLGAATHLVHRIERELYGE